MSDESAATLQPSIDLKDPAVAAVLTWFIPGLGQWYQGRRAKAALFFVCIMGLFSYGVYLGGNREVGWGRSVYYAFNREDQRWHFFGQAFVGLPTMPAVIQAVRVSNNRDVWWGGFMAPPRLENPGQFVDASGLPTLRDLHRKLARYFELATTFTFVAGLLNILAIYDAFAGPFVPIPKQHAPQKKSSAKAIA